MHKSLSTAIIRESTARFPDIVASASRRRRTSPKVPSGTIRSAQRGAGQLRIIAGRWRGRKLNVPRVNGLRPTGDRVRETLFNWLQADVAGARCLDMFAGTGALGFEALSRYAQSATFVEPDEDAYKNLSASCEQLNLTIDDPSRPQGTNAMGINSNQLKNSANSKNPEIHLLKITAQLAIDSWHRQEIRPIFDLVFIDPPFDLACQWQVLENLTPCFLSSNALIYIEYPTSEIPPDVLPTGCEVVREKAFGEVSARLIRHTKADTARQK